MSTSIGLSGLWLRVLRAERGRGREGGREGGRKGEDPEVIRLNYIMRPHGMSSDVDVRHAL